MDAADIDIDDGTASQMTVDPFAVTVDPYMVLVVSSAGTGDTEEQAFTKLASKAPKQRTSSARGEEQNKQKATKKGATQDVQRKAKSKKRKKQTIQPADFAKA
eukprot:CAMPEP_0117531976 /NCGR_PEP_ID=MMETSP0784-20121206/39133_1 /TAXON_ID=39447 /ORGANISM="" /LENGTH=102 /DNA_ID=CAMNT_0005328361 /DNA_START=36 /DNA_END=344 /DNA_ORIENTATION=-